MEGALVLSTDLLLLLHESLHLKHFYFFILEIFLKIIFVYVCVNVTCVLQCPKRPEGAQDCENWRRLWAPDLGVGNELGSSRRVGPPHWP